MNDEVEWYEPSNNLTFVLTPTKILFKTKNQACMIIYLNGNYKRQWHKLRIMIREGKIKTVTQLMDYNRPRIGGITQVQGLIMVYTEIERHVRADCIVTR